MSRPPRIEYDGAWHHVMNRGARRGPIFHDKDDHQCFLRLLSEIHETWNVETHAFSLMGNHYHLLVHTPNSNLSKAMRYLNAQYTMYYNKKYHHDGALFRGRFKSLMAEKDSYLLELVRYIHMNPVKAGISSTPEQHSWTSHAAYLNAKKRKDETNWLVVDDVLSMFGSHEGRARRKLHQFVTRESKLDMFTIVEGKKRASILGSEGFRDWVKDNLLDKIKRDRKIPLLRQSKRLKVAPQKIMAMVQHFYGQSQNVFFERTGSQRNRARSMLMYLLRRVNGMSHAEIAEVLNVKNVNTLSQALHRFDKERRSVVAVDAIVQTMTDNLLSNVKS